MEGGSGSAEWGIEKGLGEGDGGTGREGEWGMERDAFETKNWVIR